MKYIMFEDFSGAPMPVIFPNRIGHVEMRDQMPYTNVLSAGYVTLTVRGFICHGQSKGLETKAREEDGGIIQEKFSDPES